MQVLVLGAHPDDAEYHMGGTMALYRAAGHAVKVVSVTDGGAGHHEMSGPELVARRRSELSAALSVIGAEAEVWDYPDGSLLPTLDVRERIIAEIRATRPDIVFTHRTNDYHPDHRAVAQTVQDASYMVTVPPVLPHVPALRRDPAVAFMSDPFTKPCPFQADVVLDVTPLFDTILEMAHRHTSQTYEWLPYNRRVDDVPNSETGRREWLRPLLKARWGGTADRCRAALVETYGHEKGGAIQLAEAFEISEYAADVDATARARLFPFFA